jgi:hypothetical protein
MNDLEWYCDNCGNNYLAISGICYNCFSLIKPKFSRWQIIKNFFIGRVEK